MVCTEHLGPPQIMLGANLPCPCRQVVLLLPLRGPPCPPPSAHPLFLPSARCNTCLSVAGCGPASPNRPLSNPLSSLIAPLHSCHPLLDQGVTLFLLPCRLWSSFPYMRPLATITHETIQYGIDKDGASVHDVIGSRWVEPFLRPHPNAALMMCQYNVLFKDRHMSVVRA